MLFCRLAVLATLTAVLCVCPGSAQTKLTISAASSLKDAIVDAETTYRQSGAIIAFANNFGSSGTLAAQIDQGAPVDVFLSAAAKPLGPLPTTTASNSWLTPESIAFSPVTAQGTENGLEYGARHGFGPGVAGMMPLPLGVDVDAQ